MSLLLMVCLGMISLSAVESKSLNTSKARLIAEANARVALNIAIGQLQRTVGPDQRTTANAAILDKNAFSEEMDDVANPNWVGTFRTDALKDQVANSGILEQQDAALLDKRVDLDVQPEDQVMEWLVSGSDVNPRAELAGSENQDYVTLQTIPAALGVDQDVVAPLVPIESSSQSAQQGRYAYWIADENAKAKINITTENQDIELAMDDPDNGGYNRILVPQNNSLDVIWPDESTPTVDQINRIISDGSPQLVNADSIQEYSPHDFTTHSYSLLTDMRNGGLKQDMTAYLESNGSVSSLGANRPGITDSESITREISKRDSTGPKFGALRNWYSLQDEVEGDLGDRSIDVILPNYYQDVPALNNYTTQGITPCLMEAYTFYRHAIDDQNRPVQLLYPRIVVWNPYNVKLNSRGYYVEFRYRSNTCVEFTFPDPDNPNANLTADAKVDLTWPSEQNRRLVYYLEPTTFEPGEALVFTTNPDIANIDGKFATLSEGNQNYKENSLVATSDPTEKHAFLQTMRMRIVGKGGFTENAQFPNGFDRSKTSYKYTVKNSYTMWNMLTWNRSSVSAENQSVVMYADPPSSPATVRLGDLGTSVKEISALRFDHYSRNNNGRWGPAYTPSQQIISTSDIAALNPDPENIVFYGGRVRWFREDESNRHYGGIAKEPWFGAPIAFGNARTPNRFHWLRDNLFGLQYAISGHSGTSSTRVHLYTHSLLSNSRQPPTWSSPQFMAHFSPQGKYRGSIFQSADETDFKTTFPLFELPYKDLPVLSLAQLSHAHVSPYPWHPSYPIGNSLAPINTPLEYSAIPNGIEQSEISNTFVTLRNNENEYIAQLASANGDTVTTDLSFEMNYALWDRYFLSGLPASGVDRNTELPNPRLVPNPDFSNDANTIERDFQTGAAQLLVDGGFNVNSVSVEAWKALLKSFQNIDIPNRQDSTDTGYVYSRLLVPDDAGPQNSAKQFDDTRSSNLWNGYRALNDEQIQTLAEYIVRENKRRGPYLSLADFVNRKLTSVSSDSNEARSGALQTAIDKSPINIRLDNNPLFDPSDQSTDEYNLPTSDVASDFSYNPIWGAKATAPQSYVTFDTHDNKQRTRSEATAAPGYMMASDILQQIGSVITARSDTFKIRAYGDYRDNTGQIIARAYCEAVVQRSTTPINPDPSTNNIDPLPLDQDDNSHGRRFKVVSFRWLSDDEI